ncbi:MULTISPECIES: DUF6286 domain-containing protein [Gordonia]|uniref:DUF6286 domain-containing protein n=1 Tax=Gordonia sputi NBRC 100414 TaxID=1089453 RepID=H5U3N4_9ACTN|nr:MULTISPECIES: DUF6286 domain-containing protein [Gordonia]NKY93851.1 hypothetical protein [Gordonia sputi]OBC03865.1 hypothetical protein A5785_15320 [Gordonia sp. 852002-50395_SCH5434458]GAB40342.1 hypothetical protein GOSPT_098_00470 [Gordonia sputi NBRC 100414]
MSTTTTDAAPGDKNATGDKNAEDKPEHKNERAVVEARTADTHKGKVFTPAAGPKSVVSGVIIGIALLALVAVAIHDLLVEAGWVSGTRWLQAAADWINGATWQDWMWAAVVGFIIVGLLLVWTALAPRRRTHVSLGDFEVLWTRRGDVARRFSTAALSVPGVEHATTVVGRRRAKVLVTTDSAVDESALRDTLESVASSLEKKMRVKLKVVTRHKKGASR